MRLKQGAFVFLFLLSLCFVISLESSYTSEIRIQPFEIRYSSFNGDTTDFNSFLGNETVLSNFSGAILENYSFGRVDFAESLDLISMAGSDWIVDFDKDVTISDNLIVVDKYNLPGIDKRANLTIHNLSVPNPVVYKKGAICSDCDIIDYINGTCKFVTESFDGPYYIRQNSSIPYCGDGSCNGEENASSCREDCPPVCGDGICSETESPSSCLVDCLPVCGDGSCDGNETYGDCPNDCDPVCGDGVCEGDEDPSSCLVDCPPVCGDGSCDGDETTDTCPQDCDDGTVDDGGDTGDDSGGGGGSSGSDTTQEEEEQATGDAIYDFKVSPKLIETSIGKGSYFQKRVLVENNGTQPMAISIRVIGVEEFVFPEKNAIYLDAGESEEVRFDMYFSETKPANIYLGKIVFSSQKKQRETNLILNVEEREALFDIRAEVLKRYVSPGSRIRANVSLINMGDLRNFDVNLEYKIIDFDKKVYTSKEEQFAINHTYSNVFFLDTDPDMPVGDYVFYATVRYKNINATSYDTFTVERVSFISWVLLILIILFLMYLIYDWYRRRKEKEEREYAKEEKKKQEKQVSQEPISEDKEVPDLS